MWYLRDLMDACIRQIVFRAILIFAIGFLLGLLLGCEVTPYKHIIRTEAGAEIGLRCALVGGIPVACAFFS